MKNKIVKIILAILLVAIISFLVVSCTKKNDVEVSLTSNGETIEEDSYADEYVTLSFVSKSQIKKIIIVDKKTNEKKEYIPELINGKYVVKVKVEETTTLEYYTVDEKGKESEIQKVNIKIDREKPSFDMNEEKETYTLNSFDEKKKLIINLTNIKDDSNYKTYYKLDDKNYQIIDAKEKYDLKLNLTSGIHNIKVKVVDDSGKETIKTKLIEINYLINIKDNNTIKQFKVINGERISYYENLPINNNKLFKGYSIDNENIIDNNYIVKNIKELFVLYNEEVVIEKEEEKPKPVNPPKPSTKVNKPTCNNSTYSGNEINLVNGNGNYKIENNKQTIPGTYTITASLMEGYIWNDDSSEPVVLNCTINKNEITVVSDSKTKIYDGLDLTASATITKGNIYDNMIVYDSTSSIINIGTVANKGIIKVLDKNNNDVTNNFIINQEEGTLEITKNYISVTTGSSTKKYDTTPLTNSVITLTNGTLGKNQTLTFDSQTSITEPGSKENTGVIKILDKNNNDVTSNYSINQTWGTLTITGSLNPIINFVTDSTLSITSMNVTAGVKYKDLPIVEKENSSFNGWYLNDELITTNSIIPYDETISLIAHYNNSTNAKAVITDNSMYMLTTDINLDNNLYKLNNETISVIYTVPKDVYHDTKNIPWYNDNDDITKLEINKSFYNFKPTSLYAWFKIDGTDVNNTTGLTTIKGLENINVSETTNMDYLFYRQGKITNITIPSSWNNSTKLTSIRYMFSYCTKMTSVSVKNLYTSNLENIGSWFAQCHILEHIDLSNMDLKKVENTIALFELCTHLKTIDFTNVKFDKLVYTSYMFSCCEALTSIDTSIFTNGVVSTSANWMFTNCKTLTELDLSMITFNNVTECVQMFKGCANLKTLDITNIDFSKTINANNMFEGCSNLETIYVGYKWSTEKLSSSTDMFKNCSTKLKGDINWNNSNATDKTYAKYVGGYLTIKEPLKAKINFVTDSTLSITSIDATVGVTYKDLPIVEKENSTFNGWYLDDDLITKNSVIPITESVTLTAHYSTTGTPQVLQTNDTIYFVYGINIDKDLYKIDDKDIINTWVIPESGVTGNSYWCPCYDDVTNVKINKSFFNYKPTKINNWFAFTLKVEGTDEYLPSTVENIYGLENINTINVTEMGGLFYRAINIETLDLSSWNTSKVTNMQSLFEGCTSLKNLSISNFDTSLVENMKWMFYQCSSLETLDLYNFNTEKCITMGSFLAGCTSLTSVNLSSFDTSSVSNMQGMFYNCTNLTSLNLSSFNTNNVSSMSYMFNQCTKLEKIYVGSGWSTISIQVADEYKNMFLGCKKLVGGNGTPYNTANNELTYARIDTEENPGYLTFKVIMLKNLGVSFNDDGNGPIKDVTTIKFEQGTTYTGDYYDMSFNNDQSVKMYLINDELIITSAYNLEMPASSTGFFKTLEKLETIVGLENVSTSKVTDMSYMFSGCRKLKSVNLSNFDTTKNKWLGYMFNCCESIETLDFSTFDTSLVEDMKHMFTNCYKLSSLNISTFNTSKVKDMNNLFRECYSLTSIDLTGFNTSSVQDMQYMFGGCSKLNTLNVSGFVTTSVKDMQFMFYNCTVLSSIDVSNFDTSKVTTMSNMFCGCNNLVSLNISNFNTSNVTSMASMFRYCSSLTSLNLKGLDTSLVKEMWYMFQDCGELTELDLSSFDTRSVTKITCMFKNASKLKTIYVSENWIINSITDEELKKDMFLRCTSLVGQNGTAYDVDHIDMSYAVIDKTGTPGYLTDFQTLINFTYTSNNPNHLSETVTFTGYDNMIKLNNYIENEIGDHNSDSSVTENRLLTVVLEGYGYGKANGVFAGCRYVTSLDLSNLDTSNITSMSQLFAVCTSATVINVSGFNTSKVYNMAGMFDECNKVEVLDFSTFDTSNVNNMSSFLCGCNSLTSIDVSNFNTSSLIEMNYMFGKTRVTELDLSNFDTSKVTLMAKLFQSCENLTKIYVGEKWDTSLVTDSANMFLGCISLKGQNGTVYDANNIDKTYAIVDGTNPGYLTSIYSLFTELDYIESNGNQIIDTGVNADSNIRAVIDMQYTDITSANNTNFGAIYRVDDTNFFRLHFMTFNSSTFIVYYSGMGDGQDYNLNAADTNRHTFDLNIKNRTIKQDSSDPRTLSGEYVNTTLNFWLFARNSNDPELRYKNSSKLYSAKFYYDDVLVRDFVPMMRNSDNEVGLFDKINHKFYENIGTSNFASNLDE